ncbi:MAG: HigA family addiction module antitoxin [Sphingomonadales bacterium]
MEGAVRPAKTTTIGSQQQLEIAGALIVRSRVFFDAWFLSAGVEGRAEFRPFWDEMWSFWRFNEHALLFSYIVHMAGIFEARKDTINLHQIWQLHRDHPCIENVRASVDKLFAEALEPSKGITILRSTVVAHRSATLAYNEAFRKARITPNAMRELTETALKIVNQLRSLHGLNSGFFDELAIGDLRAVAASDRRKQMSKSPTTIDPKWLHNSHAGEMLVLEFMEPLGLSAESLAELIKIDVTRLADVIDGKRRIDGELDLRLARYFRMSPGFFLGLQTDYELLEAKRALNGQLDRIIPRTA